MSRVEAGAWRPVASLEALRARAELNRDLRRFLADRGVLEVETPCLASAPVTDLHLASLGSRLETQAGSRHLFLQTSPEFAMKRLLAAGSGPIFQIAKAFRDGESGRFHNPEFTMLEWYRPGFDHHDLMDEVAALLTVVLGSRRAEKLSYGELFETSLGVDPHRASAAELAEAARRAGVDWGGEEPEAQDREVWLHLLMSHCLEPGLGLKQPTFVYDYPASQAALARVRHEADGLAVAERFEVYVEGVELANGFHELIDAAEQRRRFEDDLALRRRAGLPEVPLDEFLLAALAHGLPASAGVALGVDRLLMLRTGVEHIRDVLAFPIDRA